MVQLSELVAFCDARIRRSEIKDFDGAQNGLQVENVGTVGKSERPSMPAWLLSMQLSAKGGFLICHHGLFGMHRFR